MHFISFFWSKKNLMKKFLCFWWSIIMKKRTFHQRLSLGFFLKMNLDKSWCRLMERKRCSGFVVQWCNSPDWTTWFAERREKQNWPDWKASFLGWCTCGEEMSIDRIHHKVGNRHGRSSLHLVGSNLVAELEWPDLWTNALLVKGMVLGLHF